MRILSLLQYPQQQPAQQSYSSVAPPPPLPPAKPPEVYSQRQPQYSAPTSQLYSSTNQTAAQYPGALPPSQQFSTNQLSQSYSSPSQPSRLSSQYPTTNQTSVQPRLRDSPPPPPPPPHPPPGTHTQAPQSFLPHVSKPSTSYVTSSSGTPTAATTAASYQYPYSYMYSMYPSMTQYQDTTAYPGMYSGFVSGGIQGSNQTTSAIAMTTKPTGSQAISSFNASAYMTAAAYVAQQKQKTQSGQKSSSFSSTSSSKPWWWNNRAKKSNEQKDNIQYYCETCKISCGGTSAWKMHLDGQKHKKRLSQKSAASGSGSGSGTTTGVNVRGTLKCDLCDITVVGVHAFNAHIKGAKHNKVVCCLCVTGGG